jgi:hypothetical protein
MQYLRLILFTTILYQQLHFFLLARDNDYVHTAGAMAIIAGPPASETCFEKGIRLAGLFFLSGSFRVGELGFE